MANYILLIFEGEKTEKTIFESLKNYYLNETENTIVFGVYCTDIYNLYDKVNKDPDLDLFFLLKEKEKNQEQLSAISRNNVSEIFLFFDYDGHAPTASDDKLKMLLEHFDEETENGKLYISYPMVEALKHLHNNVDFKDVVVNGKNNIKYKNIVHCQAAPCYKNITTLSQSHWNKILSEHCKKLNHLMNDTFQLPTKITSQIDIFTMQKIKHISDNSEVAVLSAFPIFIADYYGYSSLPSLIKK